MNGLTAPTKLATIASVSVSPKKSSSKPAPNIPRSKGVVKPISTCSRVCVLCSPMSGEKHASPNLQEFKRRLDNLINDNIMSIKDEEIRKKAIAMAFRMLTKSRGRGNYYWHYHQGN